jgi:hypothetical protein
MPNSSTLATFRVCRCHTTPRAYFRDLVPISGCRGHLRSVILAREVSCPDLPGSYPREAVEFALRGERHRDPADQIDQCSDHVMSVGRRCFGACGTIHVTLTEVGSRSDDALLGDTRATASGMVIVTVGACCCGRQEDATPGRGAVERLGGCQSSRGVGCWEWLVTSALMTSGVQMDHECGDRQMEMVFGLVDCHMTQLTISYSSHCCLRCKALTAFQGEVKARPHDHGSGCGRAQNGFAVSSEERRLGRVG